MTLPLLAVLFFLSGASALIYQMLWLRLLGLVFGVTVHAATTVFASFMAGLAIGSYGAGRIAPRTRRPLFWFGGAEALIGLAALSTPFGLEALQQTYVSLDARLPDSAPLRTGVRFLMSFALLIVPTAMMGATLPLIVKSSLARSSLPGANFGVLYAANTAGAIGGALTAGFLLIPALGIRRTFLVAVASNLIVAALAGFFGRRGVSGVPRDPTEDTAPRVPPTTVQIVVLLLFALSGFTSLALEVLWFRVNVLILRPTVYAFAIMLAAVLGGIAIGSAAIAPLLKRPWPWVPILAAIELIIASAGLLSFRALQAASSVLERAAWLRAFVPEYVIPLAVTSLVTIFPAMFLMGVAFPIGLHLWAAGAEPSAAPRRIGTFYAFNVCGAIAGSLVGGFLLLPALGSRTTLLVLSGVTAASALALLAVDRSSAPSRRMAIAIAGVALLVAVPIPDPFEVFLQQRFPNQPIVWRREGVQTTVSVHRQGERRIMYLDGLHQASEAGNLVFGHRRIGHLGMAIHSQPRQALVIGLGGGATAGAVSQYSFARVDVVELSPAVVQGAEFFSAINYDVLRRPNVRIRIDDGRSHLMLRTHPYDVIMADIIQPIHAGATNVYSKEYFTLVRDGLTDDGLAVQWVFGTDAEYKMIMRTFLSVFPDATLWGDGSVMIAGKRPLRLASHHFTWKLEVPEVRDALAAIGIRSYEDLLRTYTAGPAEMTRFVGKGPILTDDRPLIEYFLSLPRAAADITTLRGDVRQILAD